MIRIEKKNWWNDKFATVNVFSDLIRFPDETFEQMNPKEKDKLRQTQVSQDEIIELLGEYQNFYLARKFEGTLGWIKLPNVTLIHEIKQFPSPAIKTITAADFLNQWKGTVYEFGGLSRNGIDCSGFTQLFYLQVLGIILPKNSFDQRKLGNPKDLKAIEDFDLVFCNPDGKVDHHVVLYYQGQFWHSRRLGGVVAQTPAQFLADFTVEEVRSISGV